MRTKSRWTTWQRQAIEAIRWCNSNCMGGPRLSMIGFPQACDDGKSLEVREWPWMGFQTQESYERHVKTWLAAEWGKRQGIQFESIRKDLDQWVVTLVRSD